MINAVTDQSGKTRPFAEYLFLIVAQGILFGIPWVIGIIWLGMWMYR